jgi:hypothetical protein
MAAGPGRIRVEVDLAVPAGSGLVESVRWVAGLPPTDPDRCELEAQIYMMLARLAWRDADRYRAIRQAGQRRRRPR